MASFDIEIKTECDSYKKPFVPKDKAKAKVHSHQTVGLRYAGVVETMCEKVKWYRLSSGNYVKASNCKVVEKAFDIDYSKVKTGKTTSNNTYVYADNLTADQLGAALDNEVTNIIMNNTKSLESSIDGSTKMFGLPHQLTEKTDYRLSKNTKLGMMFTEVFISNAPILYVKPGTSNFLPGMTSKQKENMTKAIIETASGFGSTVVAQLKQMDDNDFRYFDFKGDYAEYMDDVNLLCHVGAVFLGINDLKVPWSKKSSKTFGVYDWREYDFSSVYQSDVDVKGYNGKDVSTKEIAALASGLMKAVTTDTDWVQFYVNANASFSESANNGTTSSMISEFTESLQSLGKELAFVSGVSGLDISNLVNKSTGTIDAAVNQLARGDGAISTFLKRLTGVGTQVLSGGNFLTPEIWSSSDYGKNYSFTMHLSTPYGDFRAWYLNVYVPLMYLLALALPKQTSANVYTAPRLVRVMSPGWYSCDLGIIDSISIEKGGSGDSWTINGLPNEITVTVSVKDLYANLALPHANNIKAFFSNTSLINYLMINCGIDITKSSFDDKLKVFCNLLQNTLHSVIKTHSASIVESFKETVNSFLNLWT